MDSAKHLLTQEEIVRLLGGQVSDRQTGEEEKCMPHLYHWYLELLEAAGGETVYVARGRVTGHSYLQDTTFIRTSAIQNVEVNRATGEVEIQTQSRKYLCHMKDCDFTRGDTADRIPEWERYREEWAACSRTYDLQDNAILLSFSDHEGYYYEGGVLRCEGQDYPLHMTRHIGSFQDSCLVSNYNQDKTDDYLIDFRYFPHAAHLEFYVFHMNKSFPVFVENNGDNSIFMTMPVGVLCVEPGQRMEVCEKNILRQEEIPHLDKGDLEPAVLVE